MAAVDNSEDMGVDMRTKVLMDVKGNTWIIEYYVDDRGEVRFVSLELYWTEGVEGEGNNQTTTA